MQQIKKKVINILDLKEKDNIITCGELYKIFDELSTECFGNYTNKQLLCYDQLCICLDSINDNMCDVTKIKKLTCTIYDCGLCKIEYE
jgi:hypothetical protein